MFFGKSGGNSVKLSSGKSKIVCGYEIKQMPVGAYLKALEKIESFPTDFLETFFPGKSFDDVLGELSQIDKDGVQSIISGVFLKAPEYVIALIAELSGIDNQVLLNNPDIGLHGLLEIVDAMIEVNRLGECLANLKSVWKKAVT